MSGATWWLLVLLALAGAALVVLRRMSQLVARTRDLEKFQQATVELDRRFGSIAEPLVTSLDEIRRHAGNPPALAESLPASSDALRAVAADARALRPPPGLVDRAAGLVREVDRAVRAAELVEHGLDALLATRRGRELEAQVSLKRGALNLRHSREAFGLVVAGIAAVDPADLAAIAGGHAPPNLPAVPTYTVDGINGDGEGSFNPRM